MPQLCVWQDISFHSQGRLLVFKRNSVGWGMMSRASNILNQRLEIRLKGFWIFITVLQFFLGTAYAREPELPAMTQLGAGETFRSAKLTQSEQDEIFEEIEKLSFDSPGSWQTELRVRRISLGSADGLIVQGTHLL